MKRSLLFLALASPAAFAQFPHDDEEEHQYVSPTKSEIELLEVRETSPYGSKHPLAAKVRNDSQQYLDRVAIECNITDQRGFRVFKDIVFKSSPLFSVTIAFPPVTTQASGIPPGAVADVELYTDDNRWTRGDGQYNYDCSLYGVGGKRLDRPVVLEESRIGGDSVSSDI